MYQGIEAEHKTAQDDLLANINKLVENRKKFQDLGKQMFESSGTQEVGSALSTLFKDGLTLLNKVTNSIQQQLNEKKLKTMEEKQDLLEEILEEAKIKLQNGMESSEAIKENIDVKNDLKSKIKEGFFDELAKGENKHIKEALSIIAKFDTELDDVNPSMKISEQEDDRDFEKAREKTRQLNKQRQFQRNRQ